MSSWLDSAILGIVEGLTEFIPVSSTGHLIVAEAVLQRHSNSAGVFDVVIQIGAILAVVWAERARLIAMAFGFFNNNGQRAMVLKVAVAFLPAAVFGVLLHKIIEEKLFSPWVVAVSLMVGGVVMMRAERSAQTPKYLAMDSITYKTALGIGFCQLAALIPGVSRSGASIVGAEFLGVERKAATAFSFFLAIPTIAGATVFDLFAHRHELTASDLPIFTIGTVTAFISAFFVVNRLIAFVGKHGFKPFAYYRIAFGAILLVLLATGLLSP